MLRAWNATTRVVVVILIVLGMVAVHDGWSSRHAGGTTADRPSSSPRLRARP
jgi:hypothetical protein